MYPNDPPPVELTYRVLTFLEFNITPDDCPSMDFDGIGHIDQIVM